ncbi:MAG: hypothetical protein KDA28_09840 [Phycisphaerales bacterium]|nr:hypothetical protein [Phycisphaerales bacterium]
MLHLVAFALLTTAEEMPPPVVQWYGAESAIREPGYHIVESAEAWRDLWARHRGDEVERAEQGWVQPPEVDFERYQVVACFSGPSWNANGERVVSILEDGVTIHIRYDTITYQTSGIDGGGVRCAPYGMWVIPKTGKVNLVIEENTQGLIGGEPIWTERHRRNRFW